jgi:hypothetical protein
MQIKVKKLLFLITFLSRAQVNYYMPACVKGNPKFTI